jgi:hypothetical protein
MGNDRKNPYACNHPICRDLRGMCISLGLLLMLFLSIIMAPVLALFSFNAGRSAQNIARVEDVNAKHQDYPFLSVGNHPGLKQPQWLLANVPKVNSAGRLAITNYQEDRAVREAILAGAARWEAVLQPPQLRYVASNRLQVYRSAMDQFQPGNGTKDALIVQSARTILTARILLGLWNSRRDDPYLSYNGSAVIRADEILAWRGVQKHQRIAYPGAAKRFSDGYQGKHKQQVARDIELLQQYYLHGYHTLVVQGNIVHLQVNSPYLQIVPLGETSVGGGIASGYLVSPGNWIDDYIFHKHTFLAEIDRSIFQLHPQNDQLALRIALYLVEQWRLQARTGGYKEPILMSQLLSASMISVDKANLTSRFAPRIEAALQKLYTQGVLGEVPLCLSCVDKTKAQWGKDWLASYWSIQPPQSLIYRYKGR